MSLRILIASATQGVVGGVESYLAAAIPSLAARGQAVALLYERPAPAGQATVDRSSREIPAWNTGQLGQEIALEQVARWAPQVIYAHGLASPALEAQLLARWPGVLFAHNYYGTCETGTKRHAFPRVVMCRRRFGPACLALHHARRCGGANPATMLQLYRLQAARRALLPRYRAIGVASRYMRDEYLRHGIPEDRLHVLHLPPAGIERDPSPPAPRARPDRLMMAGRLTELKGGSMLLRAIPLAARALGRPLSLTVVGDGPERPRLEAEAKRLGIAVRFLGWVPSAQRDQAFRAADLLVMPSLWPEPWGLVGLEAACAGRPTVAFAVGGIPEWLAPGESGELAPADPPSPQGLAHAMVQALGSDEHYARLCRGAWERVARYTMERHLDELLPVLAAAAS